MNLKKINFNAAVFTIGIGVGVAAVWKFFDKKYKDNVSKKIEEIMKSVKSNASELPAKEKTQIIKSPYPEAMNIQNPEKVNYSKIVERYAGNDDTEMMAKETTYDKPYVIPPSEFGENDYETISLTYYSDGLLADDMDEVIENIDETVGADSLNHFGEYEDDSVFVRNDRLKIDYEILLDNRKLTDIRRNSPCPLEDDSECED